MIVCTAGVYDSDWPDLWKDDTEEVTDMKKMTPMHCARYLQWLGTPKAKGGAQVSPVTMELHKYGMYYVINNKCTMFLINNHKVYPLY
jgi:hypothetical protein